MRQVVESFLEEWGAGEWTTPQPEHTVLHEAKLLNLDSSKARDELDWRPVWDASQAVRYTGAWYREYYDTVGDGSVSRSSVEALRALTSDQIVAYEADARATGLAWAALEDAGSGPGS